MSSSWPPLPPEAPERPFGAGVLGPLRTTDADALLAAAGDPDIRQWNPMGVTDRDQAADFIKRRRLTEDSLSWAIRATPEGPLLGMCNLFHFDDRARVVECGYWLAPGGRGRGLATRALATAGQVVFDEWRGGRMMLYHGVENVGSCRVAARAGFILEGTLRSSYRYGDELIHDEHVHGLLATDPRPGPGHTVPPAAARNPAVRPSSSAGSRDR